MRKLLSVGVVVAALLAPVSSRAGVLTLGARSGVSFGLGDAGGAGDFGEAIAMSDRVVATMASRVSACVNADSAA